MPASAALDFIGIVKKAVILGMIVVCDNVTCVAVTDHEGDRKKSGILTHFPHFLYLTLTPPASRPS